MEQVPIIPDQIADELAKILAKILPDIFANDPKLRAEYEEWKKEHTEYS